MANDHTLSTIVSDLISRRTEGAHWDFKREHQKSPAHLIHDVLCLANCKHDGDRYLIFGVDDQNYSLLPVDKGYRQTQADIVGLFRDNAHKFFQDRFPDFYLEEITVNGTLLDVLVIEDRPHKPYYLVERYEKLEAQHVYTRVGDTNTPVNAAAQPHEIERMWRERLGLDIPHVERIRRYLHEPEGWSHLARNDGCDGDFYQSTFPEYTIRVTDTDDRLVWDEEWTRGEIRTDNNSGACCELYYHQTRLAHAYHVSFDDGKKSIVAPSWRPCGIGRDGLGRFYFYECNRINYALQVFYSSFSRRDDSSRLMIRGGGQAGREASSRWGGFLQIPVVRPGELEGFLDSRPHSKRDLSIPSRNKSEQYQLFLQNLLDFDDWRNGTP